MPTEKGCRQIALYLIKKYRGLKTKTSRTAILFRDLIRHYIKEARRRKKESVCDHEHEEKS